MALRDILAHVDPSEAGKRRLCFAGDLAARHGARLTALHVREYSIDQQRRLRSAELGLASGERTAALNRAINSELDEDADALRSMLAQYQQNHAIETVWRSVEGYAYKVVPQYARYADLTVVGQDPSENTDLPDDYSFAETMLFTTGRPLLILPASELPHTGSYALGRHIAVAWNGSRASARALSDALPLIERAERTTVLLAEPYRFAHPDRLPPRSVLEHISRHSDNASCQTLQTTGASIGDALQAAALNAGADLLVAGAHGRARLWEKMLGSVTHDLLSRMRLPVLFSY
jgi:nucleotide-binding universal stress UspA family protein